MSALLLGLFLVGLIAALVVAIAACLRMQQSIAEISKRLEAYFPSGIAQAVLKRKDNRPMAKFYPAVTVVVMRINGFAALTEKLTPHKTLEYLNECLLLCGSAIHRNGGVIERFLEDGLVAVFGTEGKDGESHEYSGVRAGLEASRMVASMKMRWEIEGRRPCRIGVGVHSGSVIAGDVGFQAQRAFALVGYTTLIAQQLQRLGEELNASVLTSDATFLKIGHRFNAMRVKQVPLRHMYESHDAYIVRGLCVGELVEELSLPALTSVTTYISSDVQDVDFEEAPSNEPVWQDFTQQVALPSGLDTGRNDAPIMPDQNWMQAPLYQDQTKPPFNVSP